MDQLLAALKHDHPDLAKRMVGSLVVDAQHLSEDQLLAKARDFYAGAASLPDQRMLSQEPLDPEPRQFP
jgi:hypothetical protein